MNARKAGKLRIKVTKRRKDDYSAYLHFAEITTCTIQYERNVTTDRIMCNAKRRAEFNAEARSVVRQVGLYLIRKATFGLRKARLLKPELILRVAD